MELGEHIYNHRYLTVDKADISPLPELNDFLKDLPDGIRNLWPLSEDNGQVISYSKAKLVDDRFGFEKHLDVVANLKDSSEFVIAEDFSYDDNLSIKIDSIVRLSEGKSRDFIYKLIQKHRNFIKAVDSIRRKKYANVLRSEICLQAHSGWLNNIRTTGGYVWALQGFDFASQDEVVATRKAFRKYAADNGVEIDEKDLKYFTKPCHFSAFQCGVKVDNKNLGKAFLLQHSWMAKMVAPAAAEKESEEYRYAKAYNESSKSENRLQVAARELNKKYLKMMKKYHDRYTARREERVGLIARLKKRLFAYA